MDRRAHQDGWNSGEAQVLPVMVRTGSAPHQRALAAWARRKFTRFRRREQASTHWLWRVSRRDPNLFAHWQMGIRPDAEV
jgi:hypothetical protein